MDPWSYSLPNTVSPFEVRCIFPLRCPVHGLCTNQLVGEGNQQIKVIICSG